MKYFGAMALVLLFATISHAETWTCDIACDIDTQSIQWITSSGSTYSEAQDQLTNSCVGDHKRLDSTSCGEVGHNSYTCSGACTTTTVNRRYLTGSGADQYSAGDQAIQNCRSLGEISYYSVGACRPQ